MRGKGFGGLARSGGFTLVELLVTISILTILATIALISYGNIQRSARDARRKSDISNIQSALEQYHADQGYYPLFSASCTDGSLSAGCALKNPAATKTYMVKVPQETQPGITAYPYSPQPISCTNTVSNPATYCTNYCLYAIVENASSNVTASTCTTSTTQYQVQAP